MTTILPLTQIEESENKDMLVFIDYHKAGIMLGDYQISVTQSITTTAKTGISTSEKFNNTNHFSIAGPRFELSPGDIHAQFPPANSRGDYTNVLPHLLLTRSTLPWEREVWVDEPNSSIGNVPWLALLVIYEEEKQQGQVLPLKTVTLQALQSTTATGQVWFLDQNLDETPTETSCKVWFPPFTLEKAQQETDKAIALDIRKDLLTAILPNLEELKYLAHVRQQITQPIASEQPQVECTNELSVVISNRLPSPQGITSIYLVSLEDRFNVKGEFDYKVNCNDNDYIRLICLKNYDFSCLESKYSFRGLLTHLNQGDLRSPTQGDNAALEQYLANGYVPLPHHFRKGDRKISWYHGPLIPWQNTASLETLGLKTKLPRVADELLCYNEQTGLLDASYAAAWALGRMLSLQDQRLSVRLFNWKQLRLQTVRKKLQSRNDNYLRVEEFSEAVSMPEEVSDWFQQLSCLEGVPFNYLVPDHHMLPLESIRFFWVDPLWIDCLLDGAFSVGRVTAADTNQDRFNQAGLNPNRQITGFLLHSEVVAGFPDLLIDGYNVGIDGSNRHSASLPSTRKCTILRREKLSDTVLLCLFDGLVRVIDLSLKPEALHFGFALQEKTNVGLTQASLDYHKDIETSLSETILVQAQSEFYKNLKDKNGMELKDEKLESIPWNSGRRTIDIAQLTLEIKTKLVEMKVLDKDKNLTSAQFALQMLEGIDKVRFSLLT